jgi:hypothetical protein
MLARINKMKILLLVSLLFNIFSCKNSDSDYVYHYDPDPTRNNQNTGNGNIYKLKHLGLDAKVDVLFVVDNSGSMSNIQKNIVKNADLFMNEFIMQRHINWKLGLVSTDEDENPYLGFDSLYGSDIFDYTDPTSITDGVKVFKDAIEALGTSGSGSEYIFHNALRAIENYKDPAGGNPVFIRPTSHLAVIMVSDEKEQSQEDLGSRYEPFSFLETIKGHVNEFREVRFYGALSRIDLEGCKVSDYYDSVPYANSRYEKIIDESNGFNISACMDDFGTRLADIGKDIASMVKSPGIALRGKPKVYTIRVFYKGIELCPGSEQNGGKWYYEDKSNKIEFYSFSFVEDSSKDFLTIKFDLDDGIPRGTDPDDDTRSSCGV